jgi:hypothetical protein
MQRSFVRNSAWSQFYFYFSCISTRLKIFGSKFLLAAALAAGLVGQSGTAVGYAGNNNDYVNSSGHLVHSPSCGEEHQKRTAECRDGSKISPRIKA